MIFVAGCASQVHSGRAEGASVYYPAFQPPYYRPMVYPGYWYRPAGYGNGIFYPYGGYLSPWGFNYYSPNFYPYYFSVAYSFWPDYYGGWNRPWAPWGPPYRSHHPPYASSAEPPGSPTDSLAPQTPEAPGARFVNGKGPVDRIVRPGRPVYRPRAGDSDSAAGLRELYRNPSPNLKPGRAYPPGTGSPGSATANFKRGYAPPAPVTRPPSIGLGPPPSAGSAGRPDAPGPGTGAAARDPGAKREIRRP